jgi:ribosomal-protein-alanine N-acetyltransferase
MQIRRGTAADLPAVAGILAECPEAANWLPDRADFLFATVDGEPAGFIVWRHTAPDEIEILNLGVARQFRRRGVAKALLAALPVADVFLEVRQSNVPAQALYAGAGFRNVGVRPAYYQNPPEGAIVMRLQS